MSFAFLAARLRWRPRETTALAKASLPQPRQETFTKEEQEAAVREYVRGFDGQPVVRIVMLGEPKVGKRCLIARVRRSSRRCYYSCLLTMAFS